MPPIVAFDGCVRSDAMPSDDLPRHASVVIVGGGVMGVSAAYHLACRGQTDVLLLERSDLLGQGATGKCAGGIRHQFGTEVNIRLSIESIRMLERFESEPGQAIGLQQCGYLFLLTRAEDVAAFERNVALQRKLGVLTEWLTPEEVSRRLPLLRTDDVLSGTFYGRDGLCDPSGVVLGYATGARRMGASLLTGVEVTNVRVQGERVTAVVTSEGEVQCDSFIDAAGPFAADIGQMLGLELPITPLRRQMLVTSPLPQVPADFPFVIDFASGLYFHREGPGILTGPSRWKYKPEAKSMTNGKSAGTCGNGVVTSICRRSGVIGSSTPTIWPTSAANGPAALMKLSHCTSPSVVSTAVTRS